MTRFFFYMGLFLITASTLMMQIVQTRILSVVAWYHLAFFAISMAMFGITAGAVWVYRQSRHFTTQTFSKDMAYYSMLFAIFTVVCLLVQMTLNPTAAKSFSWAWTWVEFSLCIAIPFFFSGVVVSLALTKSPYNIGIVYGVDLLGAASGCLVALLLLNMTDGPSSILWISALIVLASWAFSLVQQGETQAEKCRPFENSFKRKPIWFLFFASIAFINGLGDYGIQPHVVKGIVEGGDSHTHREWNSFSRIAVYPGEVSFPGLWGASPVLPRFRQIEQRRMDIDGGAGTYAYQFSGNIRELDYLKYDVTNLGYYLPGIKKTAIIGVGGGRDILSAAVFGATEITGVELNPILAKLHTADSEFSRFTNIDSIPGVKIYVDEGRSWFARSKEKYDLIQMSLIDTWAATGAGAFTLSENGLYTREGWRIFLSHLKANGYFTVSRWYHPDNVNETGRLLSLAVASLLDMGVEKPASHIFLVSQESVSNLLVSKSPFSPTALARLKRVSRNLQHRVLVGPDTPAVSDTLKHIVNSKSLDELYQFTSNMDFDLTPPTDNKPFFFNQLPLNKPIQALQVSKKLVGNQNAEDGIRYGNLVATATLLVLFVAAFLLVALTILLPLRRAIRDSDKKIIAGGTCYFFLIGAGFMLIEIAMLQRLSVFLGHPVYSLSTLLFTLILSAGLGSLISEKFPLTDKKSFVVWAMVIVGYVASLTVWTHNVFITFDSASLPVRVLISILIIAPAGVVMGYGFPTGMRIATAVDRRPTPWFWGINGAAGVFSSILAIAFSIAYGINATLLLGALCYFMLIPVVMILYWHPKLVSDG